MGASACRLALVAAFVGGGAGATTAGCTASGVCVTTSDRPDAVSASSATATRFVAEDTSLANHTGNKLSLVEFHQTIPPGFTFVKDSLGACTATGGAVTCLHGLISDGQTVANTLVYRTPVLAAGTRADEHVRGEVVLGRLRLAQLRRGTRRLDRRLRADDRDRAAGFDATYVLAGTEADLATGGAASATDSLAGTWTIPGQPNDLPATATEKPNPPGFQTCPSDGKLCRSGSWFAALSPGTTSFSPYSTVVYTQYKSLIPPGTTRRTTRSSTRRACPAMTPRTRTAVRSCACRGARRRATCAAPSSCRRSPAGATASASASARTTAT